MKSVPVRGSWSRVEGKLTALTALLALLIGCESTPTLSSSGDESGDGDRSENGDGDGDELSLGGSRAGDGDGDDAPASICGNGALEDDELCDDGNTKNGDGCEGDCQYQEETYDCSVPGKPCVNTVICGNGILEGDEACDDGNQTSDDGCGMFCEEVEDTLSAPGQVPLA